MAREINVFPIVVPAGTPIAAPAVTQMAMPPRVVEEIEVVIPPGPRGEVGFRIGAAGTQQVPNQLGQWIVTDNEVLHWPVEGFHDSGSWEFTAYNTGLYPHTITVRFLVNLPGALAGAGRQPIPASALGAAPSSSAGVGLPPVTLPGIPPPGIPPPPSIPPPPFGGPGGPGAQPPQLTPLEEEDRLFAARRPDGGTDVYVWLGDLTAVHLVLDASDAPWKWELLPGSWVALTGAGYRGTTAYVSGVGRDTHAWQLTFGPGQTGWQGPNKLT